MGLIEIVLVLVVLGFCCWLLLTYVPLPAVMKQIIIAIIVLFTVLFILQHLGLISHRVHL